jgi:hypothetical protein
LLSELVYEIAGVRPTGEVGFVVRVEGRGTTETLFFALGLGGEGVEGYVGRPPRIAEGRNLDDCGLAWSSHETPLGSDSQGD